MFQFGMGNVKAEMIRPANANVEPDYVDDIDVLKQPKLNIYLEFLGIIYGIITKKVLKCNNVKFILMLNKFKGFLISCGHSARKILLHIFIYHKRLPDWVI